MRIITYNVNGIRSALKRGFADWLDTHPADVICLQEIKALESDIDVTRISAAGYQSWWFPAQKKGYSGVALLSRIPPDRVLFGHGNEQSDLEGRVLRADFGDLVLINAYFPSGTTGEPRQSYKYRWLREFQEFLDGLKKEGRQLVVCGDYNIAHREIDIHNPVSNRRSSGFLPEERQWMDQFFENGFIDTFRHLNKEPHHYSWWSVLRPSVRLENKGWRIDYINVSDGLLDRIAGARIDPDVRHSDHCPVYLELNL